MSEWIRWTIPPAIIVSLASSAHAIEYASVEEAQKQAFPSATRFAAVDGRAFRALAGERSLGLFVIDHVVGKHLYIDYAVALDPGGRVQRVQILQYRESYGGEVHSSSWLAQFVGKSNGSPLRIGNDITNISGATLSSTHVTEGVKRILAAYGSRAR